MRSTQPEIGPRGRRTDRIALCTRVVVRAFERGERPALALCRDIGLGGLRAEAVHSPLPGTQVDVDVTLPSGGHFRCRGHVAWARQTVHPEIFGSPEGAENDGAFGIAFDRVPPERLLPIARLLAAREDERRRARSIRRRQLGLLHA